MEAIVIFWIIFWLGAAVGLAFIPATIARSKGYSYGGFWALGFFFFLVGLIVALCLDAKPGSEKYVQPVYYSPQYAPVQPPPYTGTAYGQPGPVPPYEQQAYTPPQAAPPQGDAFCVKCGTAYKQGDAFCAKCGNKLA